MGSLARKIFESPLSFLLVVFAFVTQVVLIVLRRLLLPQFPSYQPLRTQIQRAYLAAAVIHYPDLPHRLPVRAPQSDARKVNGDRWTGYLIPGHDNLTNYANQPLEARRRVVLFAHGGGYARGEARMYMRYMQRWRRFASDQGLEILFLSVEYGLTPAYAHPTQRDEFLHAYKSLLDQGIHPRHIIFMGDSAGGGICINAGLEALRLSWPQPLATILISPWIDMACDSYEGGNMAVETDYFVGANLAVPHLANLYVGQDYANNDPGVNALHRTPGELEGLSPQLIIAGGAEFALWDSKRWAATCRTADVRHRLVIGWGQLHVWALGSDFIAPSLRRATDGTIIGWKERPNARS